MYAKNHVYWCYCCAILLVASSSKHQRDLTNDKKNDSIMLYELDINFTNNFEDDITTEQYIFRKISSKNMQYETSTISNYWQNDDSMWNEHRTLFIKNHTNDDQILIEYQQSTNSTEINDERNITLQEIHENWMKIEDKNNSTSYDILTNFNTDNNKNDFVPCKMCDNITCMPLCCPIGEHLIKESCIAKENAEENAEEYFLTNLNRHVKDLLQKNNIRMDRFLRWIIREPFDENEFVLYAVLELLHYDQRLYTFFSDCTLVFPFRNISIKSTSYCLDVVDENKFNLWVHAESLRKAFRELYKFNHNNEVKAFAYKFKIVLTLRLMSMLFMLITVLIYSILPELRNIHGFILRNYCGVMFVAYLADMMNNEVYGIYVEYPMCVTIALFCYYCYLATVFWLIVMSFDMWWTFRDFQSLQRTGKQQERKKMIWYSIYAWGSPFICTVICCIINFVPSLSRNLIRPKLGVLICWFNEPGADFVYYWPLVLLCAFTSICLFIITALKIKGYEKDTARHLEGAESRLYDKKKKWFKLYFQMFTIVFTMVGITWILAILLWNFYGVLKIWHQYVIYSLDMMQSLGIFVIFVCKKTIKQQLLKHFGFQNCSVFPKNRQAAVVTDRNIGISTPGNISLWKKINFFKYANRRDCTSSLSNQRETHL